MTPTSSVYFLDTEVLDDLAELRRQKPLTQCITNIVVTGFTANVLLATGASPAMVIGVEEASDFARIASALLINVGTITAPELNSMLTAARAAHAAHKPWVLDPVAAGALKFRTGVVGELIAYHPTIIKGNASEIIAVSGHDGGGRGVDSTLGSESAVPHAQALASKTGSIVVVTGETDYAVDAHDIVAIPGGDELMTRVTGTGCALGALMASFAAVSPTPLRAASSACAVFAEAGERAAKLATGPGSFAVHFLDQLALVGTD